MGDYYNDFSEEFLRNNSKFIDADFLPFKSYNSVSKYNATPKAPKTNTQLQQINIKTLDTSLFLLFKLSHMGVILVVIALPALCATMMMMLLPKLLLSCTIKMNKAVMKMIYFNFVIQYLMQNWFLLMITFVF